MARIKNLSQYSGALTRSDIWFVVDGDTFPEGMKMSGQQIYNLCKGADATNPAFTFTTKALASNQTPTATITGTYPNINVELGLPSGKDAANPNFNFSAKSLNNGESPTVEQTGTYPNLNVLLGLPAGKDAKTPAFTFTTKSIASNQTASAAVTGTYPDLNIELSIPSGKDSPNPNLQFILSMLAYGAAPTANVTGTYPNLFVTLGIPAPKNADNPVWTLEAESGEPGSNPSVMTLGTYPNQALKFVIPEGLRGKQGKPLVVLANGNYGNWDEDTQDYVDSGILAAATVDIANVAVDFQEASSLGNITTGDKIPVMFSKIAKWYTDKISKLKALAFKDKVDYGTDIDNTPTLAAVAISGSYMDLEDTPTIPDGLPVYDLGAIYLSFKKGDDDNSGTDYYHPVASFAKAVTLAKAGSIKTIQIIDSEIYTLTGACDVTGLMIRGCQATVVGELTVSEASDLPTIIDLHSHQSSANGQTENYLLKLDNSNWDNDIQYYVNYIQNKGTLSGAIICKTAGCRTQATIQVNVCNSSVVPSSKNIFFLDESVSYPATILSLNKAIVIDGIYQNVICHKGSGSSIHAIVKKTYMNQDFSAFELHSSSVGFTIHADIVEGACSLYKYLDSTPSTKARINCNLVTCTSTTQSPFPLVVNMGIDSKVDKESGKELYPAIDKTKLAGIESNAQKNVKPDWNAAYGSAAEILNKPAIPTKTHKTATLATGSWVSSSGYWTYIVYDSAVLNDSLVIVVVDKANNSVAITAQMYEDVAVASGRFTLYCTSKPASNINIRYTIL